MTPEEVQKVEPGLYEVTWDDGSVNLAAVGSRRPDSGLWLICTNWSRFTVGYSDDSLSVWDHVQSIRKIEPAVVETSDGWIPRDELVLTGDCNYWLTTSKNNVVICYGHDMVRFNKADWIAAMPILQPEPYVAPEPAKPRGCWVQFHKDGKRVMDVLHEEPTEDIDDYVWVEEKLPEVKKAKSVIPDPGKGYHLLINCYTEEGDQLWNGSKWIEDQLFGFMLGEGVYGRRKNR